MMRIAFNALSVSNLSGRHVLLGHVREIMRASEGQRHLLLHHAGNRDLADALGSAIDTHQCPTMTQHWFGRWAWERFALSRVLRDNHVDLSFSPAGMVSSGVDVPQITLAQNPWCLVPAARSGVTDALKAGLQRKRYRDAQSRAALMLYNSDYMRGLYRENAGEAPKDWLLLHQGIDDGLLNPARAIAGLDERNCEILTVSVMAPHKNIEDVVRALNVLREEGLDASLKLIGPWPDRRYRAKIDRMIADAGLGSAVEISGYVPDDVLHQSYAKARVFCLLSQCESFGIPAIEAGSFGTPSVVADCGAPPEIVGPGGLVTPLGDIGAAVNALRRLLSDRGAWEEASDRAVRNAGRFHWRDCTRPLIERLAGKSLAGSEHLITEELS